MLVRLFTSVLLLASFALAQQAVTPEPEKPKFELETFYLAILRKATNANPRPDSKLQDSHRQYWQKLAEMGTLVMSGPVEDRNIMAVMVFRAANKDEAVTIAAKDPFAQQGQWTASVHPWLTQKGVIPAVTSYDPAETYYLGFLRRGDKWSPEDSPERQRVQEAHLNNIKRLGDGGKLVAAGPFTEDTDLRGIFVFKTATVEEAHELTNTDPAVQAGRLKIELHPWKVPKGSFRPKS